VNLKMVGGLLGRDGHATLRRAEQALDLGCKRSNGSGRPHT
jgi:hypothetical protein